LLKQKKLSLNFHFSFLRQFLSILGVDKFFCSLSSFSATKGDEKCFFGEKNFGQTLFFGD
jgi:hypothetical protein